MGERGKITLLFVGGVFTAALVFRLWMGYSNPPGVVYTNGVITEIVGCETLTEENHISCLGIYCKKALFDQGFITAGTKLAGKRSSYKFSNKPHYSEHIINTNNETIDLYYKCEMEGISVTAIKFVLKEEID